MQKILNKTACLGVSALLFFVSILSIASQGTVEAAQLTQRKLTLSSSANGNITTDIAGVAQAAGSGGNGAQARHTFNFEIGSTGNVGSVQLLYCTTPIHGTTCTAPTGLDASTVASIVTQTGFSTNNFTLDTTTTNPAGCNGGVGTTRTNCILLERGSAASETAAASIALAFGTSGGWIKNPTTDNTTFFVRISTYATTAYGTLVDRGTVASSTAQQIDITARVEETLGFSVGSQVTAPGGSCTAFSDNGALNLGDVEGVLSSSAQYDAHSYFRIYTNALNGTVVYYSGDTLKDGANTITALSSESTTAAGTPSFGLAIDSADTQAGSGYNFTNLTANSAYDAGNGALGTAQFNFNTGSVTTPVAIASATSIIGCDTGSVRYVGNISTTTPAGVYTTTITYIAVPTF